VFGDVEPKLVALNALFLCHLWSMHARTLRSITHNINEFFDMQSKILLQGLLTREPAVAKRASAAGAARRLILPTQSGDKNLNNKKTTHEQRSQF
jgi:hypothetical protein